MRLLLILVLTAFAAQERGLAELTEREERLRQLFLQSREDIRPTQTPTPRQAKPTPASRRPSPEPEGTPTPVRRAIPAERTPPPTNQTPTPAQPTPEPRSRETPKPTPQKKSTPKPTATPKPTPTPEPKEKPEKKKSDAPIVVEKSGAAKDEGYLPETRKDRGFLWGLFGGGGPKYKYLTPTIRAAIDNAKIKKGRWKYIIIHNSGTRQGNAKIFHRYHKNVRKMQNGLAYQFVIGNGSSSGNGEIEIGSRWTRQINGGHVASDYLNDISIGICLVGDLNRDLPNKEQLAALEELVDYLKRRLRTKVVVKGHKQINPKPTDCPGDRFPLKWLEREFN